MKLSARGFLPCFQEYKFKYFPIEKVYLNPIYVNHIKKLLSSLVDLQNPMQLTSLCGVGKEIQTIRPNNKEGNRLIKLFSLPRQLYRIDYGNCPFRVFFSLSHENRLAYILGIETDHGSYK